MSKFHSEYGIICDKTDEKKIVKNINDFLVKVHGYKKMYKRNKGHSLMQGKLPYEYDNIYQQFLKQDYRWFFEIYPNKDLNAKIKFKEHPEVGWVIFINKMSYSDPEARAPLDSFFRELMNAVDFETIFLHQYKDGDDRL